MQICVNDSKMKINANMMCFSFKYASHDLCFGQKDQNK